MPQADSVAKLQLCNGKPSPGLMRFRGYVADDGGCGVFHTAIKKLAWGIGVFETGMDGVLK
jgi:hypothetical protein